jgi:hypothetical protein
MAILTSGDARITPLAYPDPKKEEAVDSPTPAETSALREIIQHLERDLDDAREREARLFRLLEQRSLAPDVQTGAQPPQPSSPQTPLTRRQRICLLLQKHPDGLHRKQIEQAVGESPLGDTLQKMAKKGLIRSDGSGIYALPSVSDPTPAE